MPTGLTTDGSFNAGARRTVDMTAEDAWRNWAQGQGLGRWLEPSASTLTEGQEATLKDGTWVLPVRVRPPHHLRVRLRRARQARAWTAQLRILPAARGVTIALHAEGLLDAATRAAFIERWTKELEAIPSAKPTATKPPARKAPADKAQARKPSAARTEVVAPARKALGKKPTASSPATKAAATALDKKSATKSLAKKTAATALDKKSATRTARSVSPEPSARGAAASPRKK
ncbi:hypothetical protein LY474_30210 [Myxococcus stipitatus]|uniref:hypothetical protein n=1 Tax=Myxococcus stipitatus TaxID=83455 RepID=UPI001F3B5F67|nr:hypothetical protein [Myxococcus stipitatus]MCE9672088.1 hypothetical protein [Myxococcus stipitatus]